MSETEQPCASWPYEEFLRQHLSDSEEARGYLEVAIEEYEEDGDKEAFLLALRNVAEARGGIGALLYTTYQDDAFAWLGRADSCSFEAVVTDPPYGFAEYEPDQLEKLRKGEGGIWRIPPSFDGSTRRPLPRFTVLSDVHKEALRTRFAELARQLARVLVPGAHVFIATNPLVSYLVYEPFIAAGFEKRGEIIRVVKTLRGGDRPKNAHEEFANVTVMPRACWEPWGLFRKPLEGRVQDNLRAWGTGGLRRISEHEPFKDLIESSPARGLERAISPHPSLKPQHFMRQLTRAALPLGRGTILDPFMGSGSTLAAATACDLRSVGIEMDPVYYDEAVRAIPLLARQPLRALRRAPRTS